MNQLLQDLYQSFRSNSIRTCIVIDDKQYTYQDILELCNNIRFQLRKTSSQNIGLSLTYDAEMYASLLAIWFEGKTYVPIHPDFPDERNLDIIKQASIDFIVSSQSLSEKIKTVIIDTKSITKQDEILEFIPVSIDNYAYILFTSGSTGVPKGVPITFSNLSYFVDSFNQSFGTINSEDKVLQMFELTFDMSVFSYLLPWLSGATMFGLNTKENKFLQILDLLEEDKLSVAFMVPSIINLIQPFLDGEVVNSSLRLNIFAGEPLLLKQTDIWRKFVPNAEVYNTYGPTENTIICTAYKITDQAKERYGILSIGKPMPHNDIRFENNEENEGELLLGGKLLTNNYWKNEEKNKEAFTIVDGNRYYKTGDWCTRDEEGNIFFKNRIDFQAKINGFRVELTEIEFFANQMDDSILSVAMLVTDKSENNTIALFVNSLAYSEQEILAQLKNSLPSYALPSKVVTLDKYPLNPSGKIDRNQLKNLYYEN